MIRDRLKKLEKLAAETVANCPSCVRIPALVQLPGQAPPSVESVRCPRCGNERRPLVIRVITPAMRGAAA
jgi:DNA-directed RNA polymerase subunit RPC12/RpoP